MITLKDLKNYKIVVKDNAGECNLYAAENLKKYIKKVLGVSLSIVKDTVKPKRFFSIGETTFFNTAKGDYNRQSLVDDGFRIFTDNNNNVYFDGLTPRAVMYAVFDFIEVELGCRFLTKDAEYIPTLKEISFDKINRVSIPSFGMRTYLMGDTFQQYASMDHLARTRIKDVYTVIPDKYGGPVPVYGRNVSHNFHFYCPVKKYVNKHPEWYRFMYINNEMQPTIDLSNGITDDGQLDESMEESVAKVVIEEIKKDLIAMPDMKVFMFTQEDGSLTCSNPRLDALVAKYKWSGVLIRFVNVVLKELKKFCQEELGGRKIKIMLFAYSYTSDAPVKVVNGKVVPIDDTVICDEDIIIQYALFANGAYSYFDQRQKPEIKTRMTEWRAVASDFWFWAYDTDYFRFNFFYDSFHYIGENVRGFKDYGITYLCMNGAAEYSGIWQNNIRAYAYRKLMWDHTLNADALIEEYINLYYGPVADHVKKVIALYHNHYQKLITDGVDLTFITRGTAEKPENTPIELLNQAIEIIVDAEKVINAKKMSKEDKNDYLKRIAQVRVTPMLMIFDNYGYYYPEASEEERLSYREELFKYVRFGKVDGSGDHWLMEQYYEEKTERGKISKLSETIDFLPIT